jgi:hypothetical protein
LRRSSSRRVSTSSTRPSSRCGTTSSSRWRSLPIRTWSATAAGRAGGDRTPTGRSIPSSPTSASLSRSRDSPRGRTSGTSGPARRTRST